MCICWKPQVTSLRLHETRIQLYVQFILYKKMELIIFHHLPEQHSPSPSSGRLGKFLQLIFKHLVGRMTPESYLNDMEYQAILPHHHHSHSHAGSIETSRELTNLLLVASSELPLQTESPPGAPPVQDHFDPSQEKIQLIGKFDCAICFASYTDQYLFFEHLKKHYEIVDFSECEKTREDNGGSAVIGLGEGMTVLLDKIELDNEHLSDTPPPLPPVSPEPQDYNKTDYPGHGNNNSGQVGGVEICSKGSKKKNTGTARKGRKATVRMTCPKCNKTFRKVTTFDFHVKCCQKGNSQEEARQNNSNEAKSKHKKRTVGQKGAHALKILVGKEVQLSRKDPQSPVFENVKQNTEGELDQSNAEDDDYHQPYSDPDLDDEETEMMYLQSNICPSCDEHCQTKENLDEHIRILHPELNNLQLVDPLSTKRVSKGSKNGSPKKQDVLKCLECHRIFNHRNSLVYHMRSHTGERPHKCEICSKRFFATSALKVHLRLHSGEKPYTCEYCERSFRQWGDLKYHKISIHSNLRQYQCEFCGKDFARKYSLVVHRRIHTGERNYKCEYCGKCFRAASYLQNHKRIHTGEKPYPCPVCNKPFRVRSDMKRHLNSHNRDLKIISTTTLLEHVTTVPLATTTTISTAVPIVSSVDTNVLHTQTSTNLVVMLPMAELIAVPELTLIT